MTEEFVDVAVEVTARRVAAGAALLDDTYGDWASRIDIGVLDLRSMTQCVLGQLYGSYLRGLSSIGIRYGVGGGYGYGFAASNAGEGDEWAAMHAEWTRHIEQRLTTVTV